MKLSRRRLLNVAGVLRGESFLPINIPGLIGWWDFSDLSTLYQDDLGTTPLTADGQSVGYIADKSGNSLYLAQANSGKRPVYKVNVLNGKSVARLDGVDDHLFRANGFPTGSDYYVLVVCKTTDLTKTNNLLSGAGGAARAFSLQGTSYIRLFHSANVAPSLITSNNTDWQVLSGAWINTALAGITYNQRAVGGLGTGVATADAAIQMGAFNGSFVAKGDFAEVLVYSVIPNNSQKNILHSYIASKYGIPVAAPTYNYVVCDGDSMTAGYGVAAGDNYPTGLVTALGISSWQVLNLGVSGKKMQEILANNTTRVVPLLDTGGSANGKCIYIVWAGTNDLVAGRTAAQVYADTVSHCNSMRAAGFTVIVATTLPRAGITAARATLNTSIRENYATFADALADISSNTNIGEDGDNENLTYYQADQIHLNAVGYDEIIPIMQTAVNSVV